MKINSPFKDYYDFVAYKYGGGDPRVVYPRQRVAHAIDVNIEIENCGLTDPRTYERCSNHESHYMYLVIAGKAFLITSPVQKTYSYKTDYDLSTYRIMQVDFKPEERGWIRHRQEIEFGKEYPFLIDLSRKVGAPVFVISAIEYQSEWKKATVTVCGQYPVLGRLGVPAMISPEQMYADLSMFVGNKMRDTPDTKPPVELSNKKKIEKAGFDLRQSFRHRI